MIFRETSLPGAWLVDIEPHEDSRGFFARVWCEREFAAHGLEIRLAQCSISYTRRRGTLRGMHYQAAPHEETKLVRCIRGAIHDVIIDLRQGSRTFRRHLAVELRADTHGALYIPKGFAHGFQTLTDDTEVFYQMSEPYVADSARGIRWNDRAFDIRWPIADPILLDRDATYPDFAPAKTA